MKIKDVVETILAAIPERRQDTVDTFKSGDPGAAVTGIVTTFIATRGVLQRARELGANLIITHEPTFYGHRDETAGLAGDPVFEAKRRFLEEHHIAVWRFHDHWHLHRPDGIDYGFAKKMGWEQYQDRTNAELFRLPGVPLRKLCRQLKERLGITRLRVAGDPKLRCKTLRTRLGAVSGEQQLEALRKPDTDVLVCGESPEWIACEYVRDAAAAGVKRALVVLGHCNSEEPGMEYLAEWLRPRVPGVTVTAVPAGDPFCYL
jgi:putative NIF3 family GTP cyclohydrolase 1 type 2